MSLITHPDIMAEAFKYFAKFPVLSKVQAVFKRQSEKSKFTGYEPIRTAIAALTIHSLVPELKGFIFGADENVLKRQIEDIGGEMFLFLDFGNIYSSQNQTTNGKIDDFEFSITVAQAAKPEDLDVPETVLLYDNTLNAMRKIREQMIADQQCSPFMKQILFPHQIMPWYARDLANSQGWTMAFRRSGIAIL